MLLALILSLIVNLKGYSQQIPEGGIRIDENTIIKDASGNTIQLQEMVKLLDSGKWTMDPVNDKEGKLHHMQLREATEEDIKLRESRSNLNKSGLIGKKVPNFESKDMGGNTISLEESKGKVVVLNFWFAACKPCIEEIPALNEVYEKYKNNSNVIFASITFDDSIKAKSFQKKYSFKYPVIPNEKRICDLFEITAFPTNIIIDKDGNYFDLKRGGNKEIGNQLAKSIQNALDGNSISNSTNIRIDSNSTFKLENEGEISYEKAMKLMNSKEYRIMKKMDSNNKQYFYIEHK